MEMYRTILKNIKTMALFLVYGYVLRRGAYVGWGLIASRSVRRMGGIIIFPIASNSDENPNTIEPSAPLALFVFNIETH